MRIDRSRRVRVLIAADHTPSIDTIKGLVFPDFEVVGTVNGVSEQALRCAFELNPDIILIEAALAVEDHFKAVSAISQRLTHTWIIFFQNQSSSFASATPPDTTSTLRQRHGASS